MPSLSTEKIILLKNKIKYLQSGLSSRAGNSSMDLQNFIAKKKLDPATFSIVLELFFCAE